MLRILNNPPIIRVRLKYPDVLAFSYRYAHRLTSKGLFLVVKTPSLPGAQVRFELLLEGGDVVFAGIGEITWIKPFPDSKGFYGMIIRFITLDEGCQEILQLALSQKDAARKEAFDHQKIAEDPLPDDQIETTPFISPRRFGNRAPTQDEPATNRYYALQDHQPAKEPPSDVEPREDLEATWLPAEHERPEESQPDDEAADEFEEAPTEDSNNQRTKKAISLRAAAAIPEHAPTHRNPSLALIEGLAAQQMQPQQRSVLPLNDDPSDITTGDHLSVPKLQGIFGKILSNEDDAPTDSSTKELFISKPEALPEDEDESLEFISKRHLPAPQTEPPAPRPAEADREELLITDLRAQEPPPKEENLALATTGELYALPTPKAAPNEPPNEDTPPEEFTSSNTQTKRTRPITPNDPPTSIRIMMAKPIPTNAPEQDAEMERLAQEAGLADLDSLVGWSKDLIKNMPRTPAQIEQELMALAIASKKLY